MTSDERALHAAILAAPDDDTPRLVFADWLDEHGEPERAEFIRVQCELYRLGPARRTYPAVSSFQFFRNSGSTFVEGDQPKIGEYIDIELDEEARQDLDAAERPLVYKKKWHGVLVTDVSLDGGNHEGIMSWRIEFTLDGGSGQWAGERLKARECELLSKAKHVLLGPAFPGGWSVESHESHMDQATFSRGFVSQIRCRFGSWYGGPCERCHRSGYHLAAGMFATEDPCHQCGGTGQIPGVGRRVVRSTHAVLTGGPASPPVHIFDKTPFSYDAVGFSGVRHDGVLWEPGIAYDAQHQIPFDIPQAAGWIAHVTGGYMHYDFRDVTIAQQELDAACLAWAKLA